jgi:6-phosphogluconolactonase
MDLAALLPRWFCVPALLGFSVAPLLSACGGTVGSGTRGDGAVTPDSGPDSAGVVKDASADAPVDAAVTPTVDYVYVAADSSIHRFRVNRESGALESLGTTAVGAGGVGALTHAADGSRLYATVRNTSSVRAYSIDAATGDLSDLGAVTVDGGAVYLAVNSARKWLLSGYFSDDVAAVYGLSANGGLESGSVSDIATPDEPHAIVLSPDERFAFVPSRATSRIYQYTFSATTGALAANTPAYVSAPEGAGCRHFAFHPNGALAFGMNEYADSVTTYTYDAEAGTLAAEETVSSLPGDANGGANTGADIHVHPSGDFVYASNRGHDSIAVFSVNTGAPSITRLENEPTEARPRAFALDPDGRFLYAAGQDSGKVAAYAISAADGTLSPLGTVDAASHPEWVEVVRVAVPE